jgi:hypothetical protein
MKGKSDRLVMRTVLSSTLVLALENARDLAK